MSLHRDSSAIIRYLQNTIWKFIDPMEEVMWASWEEGMDTPDAKLTIRVELQIMCAFFSNLDRISDDEARFIVDIVNALNEDYDGHWDENSIPAFRDFLRSQIASSDLYRTHRMPLTVAYLEGYDQQCGTDYATEARAMFFRVANAIAKADGTQSPIEQQALREYKELLFNTSALGYYNDTDSAVYQSETDSPVDNPRIQGRRDAATKPLDQVVGELISLIGLERVKNEVSQLVNFLQVQKMRQEKGMQVQPVSRHLVFLRQPGNGQNYGGPPALPDLQIARHII